MAANRRNNPYSVITTEIERLAELSVGSYGILPEYYERYNVKRGLRDVSGKGVVAGLTEISTIISSENVDGESVPCEGRLAYRGIDIKELVNGFYSEGRFGFEEITYLLLFGDLPAADQLAAFKRTLGFYRSLPTGFVRAVIMKAPSDDMMNTLARSVLTLYSYDNAADDISIPNVLRQCVQLIALFPLLSVYGYQAYRHYHDRDSLFIHQPDPELSTAENILRLLRPDMSYTQFEARVLDMALVLHAEHGGGNNSSFTTHVITSSGTDTYSVIAGALGSLKGPRHGGANKKGVSMMDDLKANVADAADDEAIDAYLTGLLNRQGFDRSGLIYGMGHAVYSLSDPRAEIFKSFVERLSEEKGAKEEFELYSRVERIAPKVIARERRIYKGVSANVDFYSGFVYSLLGLPQELFTPIFAIARISGWSAHRLEELIGGGKIIRPGYKSVAEERGYVPMDER